MAGEFAAYFNVVSFSASRVKNMPLKLSICAILCALLCISFTSDLVKARSLRGKFLPCLAPS